MSNKLPSAWDVLRKPEEKKEQQREDRKVFNQGKNKGEEPAYRAEWWHVREWLQHF